jgi:LuxR family maltose regulon positive regulatory protein
MDNKPLLWITYASVSLGFGRISGVEQNLKAAEAALEGTDQDKITRDLTGRIASMRAILGVTQYNAETIKTQSLRALEYLSPENLSSRTTSTWTLGQAYELLEDRAAAKKTYNETISIGQISGNVVFTILAKASLGSLQELENQLHLASETYHEILQIVGDQPLPVLCDVHLGLARIFYQWNDMDSALQYSQSSIGLARLFENTIDRFIVCEIFLSHLKLVTGDIDEAASLLARTVHSVHQYDFVHRIPEVKAQQVLTMIRQGNLETAAQIAEKHDLPMSKVQVFLARGDTSSALEILKLLQPEADTAPWDGKQLKIMALQSIALFDQGKKSEAVRLMGKVLTLTEPEGFVRIFVDEGLPMYRLLSETAAQGIMPDYIGRLVAVFKSEKKENEKIQPLIDPLSKREIEVLKLIAQGFSNNEIGEKLFLALDTVKGHNRRIFSKLDVKNRTMAITKAGSLNILNSQ